MPPLTQSPKPDWPKSRRRLAVIVNDVSEVNIGAGLDRTIIPDALNAAFVDAADFTPQTRANLPDPFPEWGGLIVA